MPDDREPQSLQAEPPSLIKNLRWLQLNWRAHWKLLLVAALVAAAVPVYELLKSSYVRIVEEHSKSDPLGAFSVKVINNSGAQLTINGVAEFYLQAPKTPGMNVQVSSGLLELDLPLGQQFVVPPHSVASISAKLANEQRLLPYLDAGEYFGLIIFSASPRPIHSEIVFSRKVFRHGVEFVVEG